MAGDLEQQMPLMGGEQQLHQPPVSHQPAAHNYNLGGPTYNRNVDVVDGSKTSSAISSRCCMIIGIVILAVLLLVGGGIVLVVCWPRPDSGGAGGGAVLNPSSVSSVSGPSTVGQPSATTSASPSAPKPDSSSIQAVANRAPAKGPVPANKNIWDILDDARKAPNLDSHDAALAWISFALAWCRETESGGPPAAAPYALHTHSLRGSKQNAKDFMLAQLQPFGKMTKNFPAWRLKTANDSIALQLKDLVGCLESVNKLNVGGSGTRAKGSLTWLTQLLQSSPASIEVRSSKRFGRFGFVVKESEPVSVTGHEELTLTHYTGQLDIEQRIQLRYLGPYSEMNDRGEYAPLLEELMQEHGDVPYM